MVVSVAVQALFLIGSNVAFLLPAVVAARDNLWYECAMFAFVCIVSSVYHVVDTIPGAHFLLAYGVWQKLDFFLAFSLVCNVTLMVCFHTGSEANPAVVQRNLHIKDVARLATTTATLAMVLQDVETPWMVSVLAALSAVAIIVAMAAFNAYKNLDLADMCIAWLFITIGAVCYGTCGSGACYWLAHSTWHTCMAIGMFLMIESRNRKWTCINCLYRCITCRKRTNAPDV
jgi:predicted RNA-binding Zn-ribbon protein involved in translation (DUF1610 family)